MIDEGSVLHTNCFPPASAQARARTLLTDEILVARAAPNSAGAAPEASIDAELAHTTSAAMQRVAFTWFLIDGEDLSSVSGVSAGDLAGHEAAHTILMPAARAALSIAAAVEHGLRPTRFTSVVPAGADRYANLETLAADAAVTALTARLGSAVEIERIVSDDARNASLRDKYARTRDIDYLATASSRRRAARALALRATNAGARLRRDRRRALLVVEYNPSHAFARSYGARRARDWRLLCLPARPRDLLTIARGGDAAILPPTPNLLEQPPSGVAQRLRTRVHELDGASLRVAGVDLWPLVRERLLTLAERYGRYAQALAPVLRAELQRGGVRAVLVPFDTPAHTRLIVRVAQAMEIPTFVINDGYKADDIQHEGMAADVALVWSTAMRDGYYARRPNGAIVTGDPRAERTPYPRLAPAHARRERWRVLIGGHAFSPVDLNCRRSDAERFLDEALSAIAAAREHLSAEVVVKLHPADAASYYREILARHPALDIQMLDKGDVLALLEQCEVYVTTYSTSLLQAVAIGLPVVYYRVNAQRLGPPFSGDEFIAARSAATPTELAALLRDRDALSAPAPSGWVERYLGRDVGATDCVIASIEERAGSPRPATIGARINV